MEARKKTTVTKRNSKRTLGNQKVAKSRGATWKTSLVKGKHDARYNPSALRLLRIKKNINQEILAKKVNVSAASYGAIERAKRFVSLDRAKLIAAKCGVPLNQLFKAPNPSKDKLLAVLAK